MAPRHVVWLQDMLRGSKVGKLVMAEGAPPHSHVNPTIRALFLITSQPPPRLQQPERWPAELVELVDRCLLKEPAERISAEQLLAHPFVERGARLGAAPVLGMIARSEGRARPRALRARWTTRR